MRIRSLMVTLVTSVGLLLMAGGTASADIIPDPVATLTCLTETPTSVTETADPATLLDPAGAPGVSCLAP
jgi:hypothetical protein